MQGSGRVGPHSSKLLKSLSHNLISSMKICNKANIRVGVRARMRVKGESMPLTERSQVYRSGLRSILFALAFALLVLPVPGAAQLGGRLEKSDFTISYTQ